MLFKIFDTTFGNLTMIFIKPNFLLLTSLLFCTPPAFSEVHKWKDAEGKTHYGDVPEVHETTVIKVTPQTADHRANASRIRAETERVMNGVAAENAKNEQNRRQQAVELHQQAAREQREEAQRNRELRRSR